MVRSMNDASHVEKAIAADHWDYRLVATLGSKSITRKLNRKAILNVDVPRACGVIKDPEAPMALRLQGNLL